MGIKMWPSLLQQVVLAKLKIDGIKVWAVMKGGGFSPFGGQAYLIIKTNGVEYQSTWFQLGRAMVWTVYSHEWALNPNTNDVWTEAEIDALQIGLILYGDWRSGYKKDSYCTQLYVEVSIGGVAKTLRPNAPGDKCQITDQAGDSCPNHWKNVDEVVSDGDTTYVHAGKVPDTGAFTDLYNLPPLSEAT